MTDLTKPSFDFRSGTDALIRDLPTTAATGLQIEVRTTPPGLITLEAFSSHLVRVHAGPAVAGSCSSNSFVFDRGDIDVYPAGTSDTWREHDSSTFLVMQLPPGLLSRVAEHSDSGANLKPRHHFRDPQVEHIAWALQAEREAGYPTGPIYIESLSLALGIRLLGGVSMSQRLDGGLTRRQLQRVVEYIEASLDRNITLTELAGIAGTSATRLKVSFRRHMGVPVHRFIVERRVEKARARLVKRDAPASQIAIEAGFSHQSHMARWMRRLLGQSPSDIARAGH